MNFQITVEGRKSIEQIQREFEKNLSEKEILTATARAINDTSKRVQGFIRKEVRTNYTINRKYLERMSTVTRMAKGDHSRLYSEIAFRYKSIPMIGFKHSGEKGKKRPITVTIKKGNSITLSHVFIATMRNQAKSGEVSEHQGIYGAGRYTGGKFIFDNSRTASGKQRITEYKSASPFTMSTTKPMEPKIKTYVDKYMPDRLRYFLQSKLDKLSK